MDARSRLIAHLQQAGLSTTRAEATLDAYAHELAEQIRADKCVPQEDICACCDSAADLIDPKARAGAAAAGAIEAPHPPRSTWTFEVNYEADKWHGIGNSWPDDVFDDAHERALADFKQRAESDKERRRFCMLRATTTYTVEAEHDPAADTRS